MKNLETLPPKLEVCGISASGEKVYPKWLQKPTGERPFRAPHVPLKKSPLWISLQDMHLHDMPDKWCEERIAPFANKIKTAILAGDAMIQYMPASVLERHGGLAWHTLRRVWDLHLAYTTLSEIRGLKQKVEPAQKFCLALTDAAFHLFYRTIFKDQLGRSLFNWKKQAAEYKDNRGMVLPFTENYRNHYDDTLLRIKGEHRIIDYLHDVASDDPFDIVIAESKLGDEELTEARCKMVIRFFHKSTNPRGNVDEDVYEKHEYMLRGVAARMVGGWDKISPTRSPTIEAVVKELCVNIMKVLGEDAGMLEKVCLEMVGYGR